MKIIKIQYKKLGKSNSPVINYCRNLLRKGESEDTRLEIYRENEEPDIIVKHIGKAAILRISDVYFKIDYTYLENIADRSGSSLVR